MNAGQIIDVFDRCFGERYLIRLCGGAEEPLYLPAVGEQPARLFFRADYAASALHADELEKVRIVCPGSTSSNQPSLLLLIRSTAM